MWAWEKVLNFPQKQGRTAAAPPSFQNDVGGLLLFEEDWGSEKHQGGPMKWEAHEVCPEIRATTFVVARFPQFLIPSQPTDHHRAQWQCIQ